MRNYSPVLPRDKQDEVMQEYPSPKLALTRYAKENASTSSVISVSHDTTALEIAAVTTPAVMRWVATTDTQGSVISAVTGANFDHVIPTGTLRRFVIPIESNPQVTSVQGVNREYGLYQRVAVKSIGIGSVLVAEY